MVIRDGNAVPVASGFTVSKDYPAWAVRKNTPASHWEKGSLDSPVGIAFSTNGNLFVVEGVPQGRLLELEADASGNYTRAKVIPIAWLSQNFTWETVKVSQQGNVFICGNVEEARRLFFGSVLMRDELGDWWVVDYGPFINFCGIDIARAGDILVVADKNNGGFSWWDVFYHVELGEIQKTMPPERYGEQVAILPDGAFALGQEPENGQGGGRVVRVDPFSGQQTVLVDGLGSIGGLITDRQTDHFFVADGQRGAVVRCRIPDELLSENYLIQQTKEAHEIREGFTPRETPGFLRDFLLKSGAFPNKLEEETAQGDLPPDSARINWQDMAFSLRDFARNIPLIAGNIELEPLDDNIKDPVERIEFVIFFPGDVIVQGKEASPSKTFFSSVRRSGKTERTRQLFKGFALSRAGNRADEDWSEASQEASMSIPLATVNMERTVKGRTVDLVFLGLGMFSDYYLNLLTGAENAGSVIVEDPEGNEERYRASFVRLDESGQTYRNLIIAGFDPPDEENPEDGIGWLNIGYSPVGSALSTGDQLKRFSSVEGDVTRMIERRTIQKREELQSVLEEPGPEGESGQGTL